MFRQVKAHQRDDADHRLMQLWIDLLVAMASCPAPNLKIETVEYLIANTPVATVRPPPLYTSLHRTPLPI